MAIVALGYMACLGRVVPLNSRDLILVSVFIAPNGGTGGAGVKVIVMLQYRPSYVASNYSVYQAMEAVPTPGTAVEKVCQPGTGLCGGVTCWLQVCSCVLGRGGLVLRGGGRRY